jgi:hypothetical protein
LLLRPSGHGGAATPEDNCSVKFDLPRCGAGEDVEKICAVSARDSLHRDFTACALGSGGGN